eukprot:TRINITY_DN789_c1_g1_i1.p1 TRINITY_DN789_c1_g1~~TRINITY_DN789_c1_g1_i1.p1  ORF type:complete len:719 (-),score=123.86 TRINITY_DN789_c1_g1_i1:258-2414(-)
MKLFHLIIYNFLLSLYLTQEVNFKQDFETSAVDADEGGDANTGRHLSQWHIQNQQQYQHGLGHHSHLANFTILHFNDWHGMYEQTDIDFTLCTAGKRLAGECAGGASRMRQKAQQLARSERSDVIIVAAGDMMMGSIYDSYYMGAATAVIMNLLPVTVMALGESDFMLGEEALISFLKAVNFPVLKPANMYIDRSSSLAPLLKDFHVMQRPDGFRVGFISYILPETPFLTKVPDGIEFVPVEPIIHQLTDQLVSRNQADMIMAIGHAGFSTDSGIANRTATIDMIISGHDHYFSSVFNACVKQLQGKKRSILTGKALCAFNDRTKLMVDRPENVLPAREQNVGRLGDIVPIYHTMWGGRYFGKLIITYDKTYKRWLGYGSVTEMLGSPSSDSVVTPDPKMERLMDKLRQPLIAFSTNKIGIIKAEELPLGKHIKYNETLAGNFVCDAIMWYFKTHMPKKFTGEYGPVSACLQDSLSFNAPLPKPSEGISYLDLINFYPMPDFMGIVRVSGEQLFEILNSAYATPERFVQVAGLKVAYFYKRPEGMKVMNAVIQNSKGKYVPIDPCSEYNIAMNTFLLDTLDLYVKQKNYQVLMKHGAGIQHIMYLYLATKEKVKVKFENRVVACEIEENDHEMCGKPGSHDYLEVPECLASKYTSAKWKKNVIDSWEGVPDTKPINTKLCFCESSSDEYKNYRDSGVERAIKLNEKELYNAYVLEMKL